MISETAIDQIADAVAQQLRAQISIPLHVALWSSAECAQYFKRAPRQFMERIAPLPSFPRAIRLPGESGKCGRPLWKAAEVIAWAAEHQEKA